MLNLNWFSSIPDYIKILFAIATATVSGYDGLSKRLKKYRRDHARQSGTRRNKNG
jgi:hypothetical protein